MMGACSAAGRNVFKAEPGQSVDQDPAIVRISPAARGDPAFCFQFGEGLIQRGQDVGRRGEAPLAGIFPDR